MDIHELTLLLPRDAAEWALCQPLLPAARWVLSTDVEPEWPVDPAMGQLQQTPPAVAVILLADGQPALPDCPRFAARVIEGAAESSSEAVWMLSLWSGWPGLSAAQIHARWARHAALARSIHWGADAMLRLQLEDGGKFRGLTAVRFPDMQSLIERQYDSPEAAYALLEDSTDFIVEEAVFYGRNRMEHS